MPPKRELNPRQQVARWTPVKSLTTREKPFYTSNMHNSVPFGYPRCRQTILLLHRSKVVENFPSNVSLGPPFYTSKISMLYGSRASTLEPFFCHCQMTDWNLPPAADELEVTVLGPGYGEAIVIHYGKGQWVIVDSCKFEKGETAPLVYLRKYQLCNHYSARVDDST